MRERQQEECAVSKTRRKTTTLVQMALLAALIAVLSAVPWLGYINLGFINATTVHIPVIIGGILLGPKAGGVLGGFFGLTSLLKNTFQPNLSSFVFSPFYGVGETHGNLWSLVICLVPRILIGVAAGLCYRAIARGGRRKTAAMAVAAVAGSLCNTLLVMGGIYLFFGPAYAAAQGVDYGALFGWIAALVGTVGVPEALVAAVLSTAVCRPLLALQGRGSPQTGR